MNERYERLFSLSTNSSAEDAPVKIVAAALSRDYAAKRNVIQVKFQNCSQQDIEALSAKFILKDQQHNVINEAFVFDYRDLQAHSGECFGDRIPVLVSDAVAAFDVELLQVKFSDAMEWRSQEERSIGETAQEEPVEMTSVLWRDQQSPNASPVIPSDKQADSIKKKRPVVLIALIAIAVCLLATLVLKNTLLQENIAGRWDAVALYIDGELYPFPDKGYIEINRDHTLYLQFNEDTAWEGRWLEEEDVNIDNENIEATYYIDLEGLPRGFLCLHGGDRQQVSVTLPVEVRDGEVGTVIFEKEQEL